MQWFMDARGRYMKAKKCGLHVSCLKIPYSLIKNYPGSVMGTAPIYENYVKRVRRLKYSDSYDDKGKSSTIHAVWSAKLTLKWPAPQWKYIVAFSAMFKYFTSVKGSVGKIFSAELKFLRFDTHIFYHKLTKTNYFF